MTEEEIIELCKYYDIENYKINSDMTIDVNGSVNLIGHNLKELPLKFQTIHDDFTCSFNQLTSLKGCPRYVGDYFYCQYNNLTSLEGCPSYVGGHILCECNNLTTRQQISLLNVCGTIHSTNLWKF